MFIELHRDGQIDPVYVNTDQIEGFQIDNESKTTTIWMNSGGYYTVTETPKEILSLLGDGEPL